MDSKRIIAEVHSDGRITTDKGWYLGGLAEIVDFDQLVPEHNELSLMEAKLERAQFAIQAAIDCGIIPNSTAQDSGAASRSEQVRVADMLRAALKGGQDEV